MILLSFLVQLMVVLTPMTSLAVSTENTLNEPMNKIQTYMSKQEVVIITDSYHIGDLKGDNVGIDAIVLYKPGMKTKVPGIRMSLGKAVKTEQVYYSYLDLDQIEGLSSAISSMIKKSCLSARQEKMWYILARVVSRLHYKSPLPKHFFP